MIFGAFIIGLSMGVFLGSLGGYWWANKAKEW